MDNINFDNLPTYDQALEEIKKGLYKENKFFDYKEKILATKFINQKEYNLQEFIAIELTKKLFNNVKTEEVLEQLHIKKNETKVNQPSISNNEVEATKNLIENPDTIANTSSEVDAEHLKENQDEKQQYEGWKAWLHFFSNYNVLSTLNLYDDEENTNITKPRFASLAVGGLCLKTTKFLFVLSTIGFGITASIPVISYLKNNQNNLKDILSSKKFLISAITIFSFIFIAALASLVFKLRFEAILRKRELKLEYKLHYIHELGAMVNFSVDNALTITNTEESKKITFNKKTQAEEVNDTIRSKDKIPLYKTGSFSKSGTYNFFHLAAISLSLGIIGACVGKLLNENEKFANATKHIFDQPQNLGYMILGCIACTLLLYAVRRLAEPIWENVIKPICTLFVDLFVDLMKTIWEGLKFVGRAIEEGCRKALNVVTFSGFDQIGTRTQVNWASTRP
jgi:hypothetical protein